MGDAFSLTSHEMLQQTESLVFDIDDNRAVEHGFLCDGIEALAYESALGQLFG